MHSFVFEWRIGCLLSFSSLWHVSMITLYRCPHVALCCAMLCYVQCCAMWRQASTCWLTVKLFLSVCPSVQSPELVWCVQLFTAHINNIKLQNSAIMGFYDTCGGRKNTFEWPRVAYLFLLSNQLATSLPTTVEPKPPGGKLAFL